MRINYLVLIFTLIFSIACSDLSKERKYYSDQIIKIDFENHGKFNQGLIKNIDYPIVIEVFVKDLNYEKFEKENAKQDYYYLTDFRGNYSEIIAPLLDSLKIQRFRLNESSSKLNFIVKGDISYLLDPYKIIQKQYLILFNGKNEPIIWNGNLSDGLDDLIKKYFLEF